MLHILGVTHTVCTLARVHDLNVEHAALVGLLHDVSKDHTPEAIHNDLARWNGALDPEDLEFPRTWHGIHAAYWARHELGFDHPEVFEAVALHTTADAAVGPLCRALYVADYCEPSRLIETAPLVLQTARDDLDAGFRRALAYKAQHLWHKRLFQIHPRTHRAVRYWLDPEQWQHLKDVAAHAGDLQFLETLQAEAST